MNERIQELYKEAVNSASAELHEWNKNWQPGKHTNFEYEKVLYKKFAELIVDECMLINRQRLFPDYEGDSHRVAHNNALLCANSDLREHFGVEL